ncbi:GNAT family N-acetyltransferase [Limobrevibacterium gyesilva]|uniref:GNAT family N-acetyltransferase n=1 Tax=Limobrevibacterium gyesilva TaxID=2991712 RepID=A0AA41YHN7_9PROT|nr:GNAT family N-acetyltransferase [Limobrevibacterium gyesilva]MCW3473564.1 GNAT family N-acetyltransferase [Limobrevibacterium gyesilva]
MAVPALATARLALRPRSEVDMPAMLAMAGDPEVMRYFRTRPGDDPEAYRAALQQRVRHDDGPGLGYWSLFPQADPGRYLGWVSLDPLAETPHIQLGYRLVRAAWGGGYVTEASRRVLEYGFDALGLGEIVAIVHPDNTRSQAVIRRLGFTADGMRLHFGRQRLFYRLVRTPP